MYIVYNKFVPEMIFCLLNILYVNEVVTHF